MDDSVHVCASSMGSAWLRTLCGIGFFPAGGSIVAEDGIARRLHIGGIFGIDNDGHPWTCVLAACTVSPRDGDVGQPSPRRGVDPRKMACRSYFPEGQYFIGPAGDPPLIFLGRTHRLTSCGIHRDDPCA